MMMIVPQAFSGRQRVARTWKNQACSAARMSSRWQRMGIVACDAGPWAASPSVSFMPPGFLSWSCVHKIRRTVRRRNTEPWLQSGIKAGHSQAVQRSGWEVFKQGLHGWRWSPPLGWTPHHEQIHPLYFDSVYLIYTDCSHLSKFNQCVSDDIGNSLRIAKLRIIHNERIHTFLLFFS